MTGMLQILRKDLQRSGLLLLLWNGIAVSTIWNSWYRSQSLLTESQTAPGAVGLRWVAAPQPMVLVLFLGIFLWGRTIQEDLPSQGSAPWLTRPISGSELLVAKVLFFVLGFVTLPTLNHLLRLQAQTIDPNLWIAILAEMGLYWMSVGSLLALAAVLGKSQRYYWILLFAGWFLYTTFLGLVWTARHETSSFAAPPLRLDLLLFCFGFAATGLLSALYLRRCNWTAPLFWAPAGLILALPVGWILLAPPQPIFGKPAEAPFELVDLGPTPWGGYRLTGNTSEKGSYLHSHLKVSDPDAIPTTSYYSLHSWNLRLNSGESLFLHIKAAQNIKLGWTTALHRLFAQESIAHYLPQDARDEEVLVQSTEATLIARSNDLATWDPRGSSLSGYALMREQHMEILARLPLRVGAETASHRNSYRIEAVKAVGETLEIQILEQRFRPRFSPLYTCQDRLGVYGPEALPRPSGFSGSAGSLRVHSGGLLGWPAPSLYRLTQRVPPGWQREGNELIVIRTCPQGLLQVPINAQELRLIEHNPDDFPRTRWDHRDYRPELASEQEYPSE